MSVAKKRTKQVYAHEEDFLNDTQSTEKANKYKEVKTYVEKERRYSY